MSCSSAACVESWRASRRPSRSRRGPVRCPGRRKNKPWDYFMLVEMGPDRLHHVFWHHFDPQHRMYEPGNRFESAFQDYYRFLDGEVGALLETLPEDCVTILMSDHGARRMAGGVC